MRILAGSPALFIGQHCCPEFDCPQGPFPGKLQVLLCLVDGVERRRQIQAKLNVQHPSNNHNLRHRCDDRRPTRMKRTLPALWLIGAIVYTTNGAEAQSVERASIQSVSAEVHSVVVDAPQVISLSYASPEAWGSLPSVLQPDEPPLATGRAVRPSPGLSELQHVEVKSTANIHSGPSAAAEIIGIAHAGAEVQVASRDAGWVQIIDPWSWRTGWIFSSEARGLTALRGGSWPRG